MSRIVSLLSIVSLCSLLTACGSDDASSTPAGTDSGTTDTGTAATDTGAASDTGTKPAPAFTGKLAIPADFTGEAVRVVLAASSSLPLAGPPDGGILFEDKAPKITAGGTYEVKADASILTGKYYVLAIIFVKGGGTFAPKADVDYDAATKALVTFDGKSPVDMGTLTMALHKTGDGH